MQATEQQDGAALLGAHCKPSPRPQGAGVRVCLPAHLISVLSFRYGHIGPAPTETDKMCYRFRLANRGRALWTRTRVIVGDLPSGSDRRKYPVGGVFLSDWGEEEEI